MDQYFWLGSEYLSIVLKNLWRRGSFALAYTYACKTHIKPSFLDFYHRKVTNRYLDHSIVSVSTQKYAWIIFF